MNSITCPIPVAPRANAVLALGSPLRALAWEMLWKNRVLLPALLVLWGVGAWLAHAIASACAGENHLWEDMAMPNRDALSQLIKKYFPTLYFKNTANLRWKKFFYKLLCDRAQARLCKAPSCGVCCDYAQCFGPE